MDWYGERCPSIEELEALALGMDVPVIYDYDFDIARLVIHDDGGPWFIGIPAQFGALARAWALAHELGHLVQPHGPTINKEIYYQQEHEANWWAARALIPFMDDMCFKDCIFILRENYQDWGPGSRIWNLAAFIAYRRLGIAQRAG